MSHVKSLEIGTAPHCLNSHAFRCNVKVKVHSITVGWYALRGVYLWSWEGGLENASNKNIPVSFFIYK